MYRSVQRSLTRMNGSLASQILSLSRGARGAVVSARTGGTPSALPSGAVSASGNDPVTGSVYFTLDYSTLDGGDVLAGTSECEE